MDQLNGSGPRVNRRRFSLSLSSFSLPFHFFSLSLISYLSSIFSFSLFPLSPLSHLSLSYHRKNTILIDSPGFGHEEKMDDIETNLAVLQYFYHLSHLTLFFIPSTQLTSVSTQLEV